MKIGQNPELPTSLTQQVQAAKQQAKAAPPAPAAEEATKTATTVATTGGTPVTFSSAAKALDPSLRSSADFDANKVKAVRAAIEKGTFTVDAEAIADKLLSNAQETIAHSPKSH
ncbi:flagellar biosynthesis anti-sigma factor FlgM [Paracidovorax citrulli]|uniref:Negative regulator of flagellin synthesis n=2 Tax=Paracidovorax citrulli TaxID=80869 RepID=A1TVH0_PARC0|nr:flagellar biosynthesis anti-sigma factor FlgM [Paracidovorax citrulli]ABM34958.1 anti-sigma-28 factor, FlgM [Paracidovorax citrulli AAC00-1]ATG96496.1 flagellar biosynthesis anti-sigma factor FlgM [Paracidovorax citrulli]PVY64406.1 FlgM family anti-sigma-28 factor [Paracidovorax citrulli]REG71394.1 FlgM family anti-sigma-28 factor [Paracidovorax citrulli]RLJ95947.1 FlgM family anti-sigma-28 factor [Paracidovorax citrulli]